MTDEAANKEDVKTANTATEEKKKKRKTKIYRYPSNIGSDEQPHAINFYIFRTESSEEVIQRKSDLQARVDAGDKSASKQLAVENDRTEFLALTGGTLFGVLAGGAVATKVGGVTGATAGSAMAFASGKAATELMLAAGATQARSTKKIDSSISLYIPNSPQAKYGAEFNVENLGTIMGGGMGNELGIQDTFKKMSQQEDIKGMLKVAADSPMGSVLARTISSAGNLPRELGLGELNVSGAVRSATRTVRNPYKEQIFQTMGFRSFAFEYKFAPRNEKELRDVMEIIKLFKSHMHPEKDLGGLFFTFPSEFQIEYVYKNRQNTYLNKIAPCFLTDLSVDYGNGGTFTTFKDARGAPSEITMSMAFRETELLTKSKVEEGF